jgi:hypothetical protein
LRCIDFGETVLVVEGLRMSTITHTSADYFERLPWPLYETAVRETQEIAKKQNGG